MDQPLRARPLEPMTAAAEGQTSPDVCRAGGEPTRRWHPTRLEAAVTGRLTPIERDAMNAHGDALAAQLEADGYSPWLARRMALHDALTLRLMTAAHAKMSQPYLRLALRYQRHLLDMLEFGRRITAPTGAVVNISATTATVGVVNSGADQR